MIGVPRLGCRIIVTARRDNGTRRRPSMFAADARKSVVYVRRRCARIYSWLRSGIVSAARTFEYDVQIHELHVVDDCRCLCRWRVSLVCMSTYGCCTYSEFSAKNFKSWSSTRKCVKPNPAMQLCNYLTVEINENLDISLTKKELKQRYLF